MEVADLLVEDVLDIFGFTFKADTELRLELYILPLDVLTMFLGSNACAKAEPAGESSYKRSAGAIKLHDMFSWASTPFGPVARRTEAGR